MKSIKVNDHKKREGKEAVKPSKLESKVTSSSKERLSKTKDDIKEIQRRKKELAEMARSGKDLETERTKNWKKN